MQRFLQLLAFIVVLEGSTTARAGDLSGVELRDARQLYTGKCARCHKFYDPARYSDQKWNDWMEKMSRKAKLKPDQKELLSKYLQTLRATTATNTTPPSR